MTTDQEPGHSIDTAQRRLLELWLNTARGEPYDEIKWNDLSHAVARLAMVIRQQAITLKECRSRLAPPP